VARLRAAQNQYKLAEQFVAAGLKNVIGNGCAIADFYTTAEWSLLARTSERQGTIQYLVGSRLSYLGVSSPAGAAQAKANSVQTMRRGANDGYIKLLGVAGQARAGKAGCALGEKPDQNSVTEMALTVLETQRQAREVASGRNIFGFDVTFTPARAYRSSIALNCATNTEANRGLWDEAYCSAARAQVMQERAENKDRDFDKSQADLRGAISDMIAGLDTHIDNVVGCNRTAIGADEPFFACARTQIKLATACLEKAHLNTFDACMTSSGLNAANDITTALYELRSIYLEYEGIKTGADNIQKRITLSKDAKKGIVNGMYRQLAAQTVATLAQVAFDGVSCIEVTAAAVSSAKCLAAAGVNAVAQGAAGAASTEAEIAIVSAENKQEIENLSLDLTELAIAAQAAQQAYYSKKSDVKGMLTALDRDVIENERQRAYFASSPANDPSFRIVRDSARLELAEVLEKAAKIAYLAARRAEYEYAARLAASGFAISDIYRARTAQDILNFLDELQGVTGNLAGAATQEMAATNIPLISVALDHLHLTDDKLRSATITTTEAIAAERTRQFREWVLKNTRTPPGGKPMLVFTMTTSLQGNSIFANVLPVGFDQQWRFMLGGIGSPKPDNVGVSINLESEQPGLSYRKVVLTQNGVVHLRSFAGCIFNYRLVAPAVLLGREWPANQDAEAATALFNANVNSTNAYSASGFRTERFEGRPISATEWRIEVFSAAPQGGLADMDLQKLTDIELLLSATYSTRQAGNPDGADCARVDF
jgi:hypothetical protein